tara:strand:+ start:336 stop:2012 length:1677 start_codon:yes stop_codon:yes gene_type:complete
MNISYIEPPRSKKKSTVRCPLCHKSFDVNIIRGHYKQCMIIYQKYKRLQKIIKFNRTEEIDRKNRIFKQQQTHEYKIGMIKKNKELEKKEYYDYLKKEYVKEKEIQLKNQKKQEFKQVKQHFTQEKQESQKKRNKSRELAIRTSPQTLYQLYTRTEINNKYTEYYNNYLNNKNVVLVGPASSIINTNSGDIINSFDIIVRLNKSLPLSTKMMKDIGNRTDILYNSLNRYDHPGENILNEQFFINNKLKFLCSSYPNITPFSHDIKDYLNNSRAKLPFRIVSEKSYHNIKNSIKTRPNTGIMTILDLLQSPIKTLYITGLNFYKTDYYKTYTKKQRANRGALVPYNSSNMIHNQSPQINLLRHLALNDKRIILDRTLYRIVYTNYISFFGKKKQIDNDNIFNLKHNPSNNTSFIDYFTIKPDKVLFVGLLNNLIDISNYSPDLIITINHENIKNSTNIPVISLTDNKQYNPSYIKSIIKLNNTETESNVGKYKCNKQHYSGIMRILSDLSIYPNTQNTTELYILLCMLYYFPKLKIVNTSFQKHSEEYLLCEFIKTITK